MRRMTVCCASALLLVLTVLSSQGADKPGTQPKTKPAKAISPPAYGNADAINQDELKVYLYFLAADQLEGRNFPSRGYDTAALYVASHLAEWGLKPGGSTSGTNGPLQPYLMPIELVSRQVVPADSKITLTAPPAGGGRGGRGGPDAGAAPAAANASAEPQTTTFEYARDWSSSAGGRGAPPLEPVDVAGNLVFAGNGYVVSKTKANPYEGLDVRGKIVVIAGLPPELAAQQAAGRGRGAAGGGANATNPLGENCTDFLTPEEYAAKNGALAVVSITSFQQMTAGGNGGRGGGGGGGGGGRGAALNGPNYQVKNFPPAGACPSAPSITAGVELTNALFQGEKVSGSQIFYAAGMNTKQDSFELNSRKKLSLHLAVRSEPGHGENVVGILEGGDPVLKNEYVVMSAHLDHIGLSAPLPDGHNVNNGADDDGSGSAGLLAVAHAYAAGAANGLRPKRSIVFLWNGGEEKGLLGSQYYAEFPPIDLTKVVADLNMDMIGRTQTPQSVDPNATHVLVKPGEVLLIGPGISSDDLEHTIEGVNSSYQKLTLNHFYDTTAPDATHDNLGPPPNGQRVFYRSDHYNFAKMGIPIAFFTTGLHVDYHRPTDTPDKIDYQAMQQISKTLAATGWELANQSGRPKLKAALPEQLLKDMNTARQKGWGKITPVLPPLPGEPY